jgi:FtsP/CotA-like multicopper oxidase with cupredoxin domain
MGCCKNRRRDVEKEEYKNHENVESVGLNTNANKNNMKYTLGFVTAALIIGGIWYTQSGYMGMSMNMDGMMAQEIKVKDNLSILENKDVPLVKPTEVVELKDGDTFDLTASIVKQEVGNRTVKRLAYNGQIPGPVLKVEKGSKVTVNFTNNLDMETALHSHGLRGDYLMDGAVPITPAIKIGESFSYELVFPDTGVFWYHPHVREDYQQDMGLYGNFIVTQDGYWNEVDNEEYLIVDDILEDGEYSSEVVTNTLMGRFGDKLLINDTDDYNLTVGQGEITRVFITNVANTRTFKLEFEGAQMKLVGGDTGRIEQEEIIDHQIIGTSERYVIELYYDTPGTFPIVHRGETMGMVTVEASDTNRQADFMTLRLNAEDYSDIRSNIAALASKAPDKNLRLDIEMKGMMGEMMDDMSGGGSGMDMMGGDANDNMMREHCKMMPQMSGCEPYLNEASPEVEHGEDGIEWEDDMAMMNQMSTDENIKWFIEDTDTKKRNEDIDWSFNQGDMVKVRIFNDDKGMHPMQHPIHFHGQKFVVLTRDGEVNENLQWKDSVLIPTGQTVDLLVDMSNPGTWMTHCHIAEHLHSGMMFNFEVN